MRPLAPHCHAGLQEPTPRPAARGRRLTPSESPPPRTCADTHGMRPREPFLLRSDNRGMRPRRSTPWIFVLPTVTALLIGAGCGGSGSSKPTPTAAAPTPTATAAPTAPIPGSAVFGTSRSGLILHGGPTFSA